MFMIVRCNLRALYVCLTKGYPSNDLALFQLISDKLFKFFPLLVLALKFRIFGLDFFGTDCLHIVAPLIN